tara:strand:- start:1626 stop:1892 length:267 start_codon:yes stop_codon:yes gene_type:complete
MAVTFEQAIEVLHDPFILTWIILAWLIPLSVYFIIGIFRRGRSANGNISSKPMIASINFWIGIAIYFFIQLPLLILLAFPIWLRWIPT